MSIRCAAAVLAALCLLPATLPAAVYTVGPGGTHATIQSAMDTARLTTLVDDEVRIAQGTWTEQVAFASPGTDDLHISGGWNATFDVQTIDPALTVIDGEHGGVAFSMLKFDGVATLRNLTFARGRYPFWGASLVVGTNTFAHVEISDCVVRDGEVLPPANTAGRGGGVHLTAAHTSEIVMERCVVRDNLVQTDGESGWGGGVYLGATGSATIRLSEVDVHHNTVSGPYGMAGIAGEATGQARIEISDSVFADNVVSNGTQLQSISSGAAFFLDGSSNAAQLEFRRNRVLRNTVEIGPPAAQMVVRGAGTSTVVVGDSLIVDSARDGGLVAVGSDAAEVSLVNLTVAGNAGIDLTAWSGVDIGNTLVDSVNEDIGAATIVNSRLGDPGYVDRASGDYRLLPDSPAIDAGSPAPAAGLGPFDVEGNPRVRGYGVDQGAYEAASDGIFASGFE